MKSIKMCQYSMEINSSQLEGAKGAKVVNSITSEAEKSMDSLTPSNIKHMNQWIAILFSK